MDEMHGTPDPRLSILLLPGTLCNAAVFQPLLAELEAASGQSFAGCEFRVVELPPEPDITRAARCILADAPDHFAIIGFSLGGIIALEIAALAPQRVIGLALLDSNARAIDPAQHGARLAAARQSAQNLAHHVGETLWPDYVGTASRADAALRNAIVDMALAVGPQRFVMQIELALSRPDSRARIMQMAMPALVLAGSEDALCPPDMQRELAAGLPHAVLAMIEGAGHFALLEAPQATSGPVAQWIDSLT